MPKFAQKALVLLLSLALLFTFFACNTPTPDGGGQNPPAQGDPSNPDTPNNPDDPNATPIKNLIIIIGDGMGAEHIAGGQLVSGREFAFTEWQQVSVNTNSLNSNGYATKTTDSAASATALATGTLTLNSYLGKDSTGKNLLNIMEFAKSKGKLTGVLTTDLLSGATPSGFSAHAKNRNDSAAIIASQLTTGVDFLCGQSDRSYTERKGDFEAQGYTYCNKFDKRDEVMGSDKLFCQFAIDKGTSNSILLKDAATFAIEYLSQGEEGFVLMIEQAHIDKASHSNNFEEAMGHVESLADTVDAVMALVGDRDDTAVLVTADHETGGLSVSANPAALPIRTNTRDGSLISYHYSIGDHSDDNVLLFVWGVTPDFAKLSTYKSPHFIKNIDIHQLMLSLVKTGKCP